jgi:hypothetical protein
MSEESDQLLALASRLISNANSGTPPTQDDLLEAADIVRCYGAIRLATEQCGNADIGVRIATYFNQIGIDPRRWARLTLVKAPSSQD